ncbi:MAG: efflux RND transporter periplasmic adaptor subunit [Acidobacteria bacterium]|nr:efflux RND transporter periplasmic adaptor subunit [Acidobacteriota bacterium]
MNDETRKETKDTEEAEMTKENMSERTGHHERDEAELARLENDFDRGGDGAESSANGETKPRSMFAWILTAVVVAVFAVLGLAWIATRSSSSSTKVEVAAGEEKKEEDGHSEGEEGREVKLDPESVESAGIEVEGVTQRPAIAKLYVTGAVELNPEKTEMATPLVGGRIDQVFYGVGDYVERGAILATISSPQLAELHGKLNEARNRLDLAQKNLARVQKTENRVSILQAKAKLDEADATLRRTRRLIELGAGAGKDLIAAEAGYRTAKADYDFQSNIALNRELQQAQAEVQTARVDFQHTQNQLRTLGSSEQNLQRDDHSRDASVAVVRAPLSGVVTERKFNAGAGIDAASPLFAISNLSSVYVIANVPEANVGKLVVGSVAEIRSTSAGTFNGRISYIDPRLDEATRTARVRLEVPNPQGRLRAGTFTEVGFYTGTSAESGEELVVPSAAIQREGDKAIVFIPKEDEPGAFEIREIEIGGEMEGYTAVKSGLKLGEKVVSKGSFTLKTQMQKGEMGEHGH